MASKTFTNNSGLDLSVLLTIRNGDNPANTAGVYAFDLPSGQSQNVQYAPDSDPYLNAISVSGSNGGTIAALAAVSQRGGFADNQLNMNDEVAISLQGASLVLSFGN